MSEAPNITRAEFPPEREEFYAPRPGGGELVGTPAMPLSDLAAPRLEPMLRWFAYEHLPEKLAAVSMPFGELARHLVEDLPSSAERTVALRKLLEAKDAAVRAALG